MSLTIIEALKKKGSTGGNTIMEAIENLPDNGGGSGGGVGGTIIFVPEVVEYDGNGNLGAIMYQTYEDLELLIAENIVPYILIVNAGFTEGTVTRNLFPLFELGVDKQDDNFYFYSVFGDGVNNIFKFKAYDKTTNLTTYLFDLDNPK